MQAPIILTSLCLTHLEDLPRSDDPIMQSVDHVEDVGFTESHLAILGIVVVEVGSAEKKDLNPMAAIEI